jgi:hypothetical protein
VVKSRNSGALERIVPSWIKHMDQVGTRYHATAALRAPPLP